MSTFSISGNVGETPFISNGTPNVTVVLSGAASASTTTDVNGNYTFSGLSNGNYVVTPTPPPVVYPAFQNVIISGTDVSGINFAELGVVTGTVATMEQVFPPPGYATQTVQYIGTIEFSPGTLVFFNSTGVLQASATPTVGATVQFDFAQVYTAVNKVGVPSNPQYIGEAVDVFVTS